MDPALPPYLEDAFLAEATAFAALPPEIAAAVRAAAGEVRKHPDLIRVVRDSHERVFRDREPEKKFAQEAPELGEHAGMLPVLVLFSGLPRARAFWKERAIPDAVAIHTLSDIGIWMRHYRARTGRWGLKEFRWLQYHLMGRIYRLGRVQFMVGKHWGWVHAFRHRRTGAVRLLAQAGRDFHDELIEEWTEI
ncbi:MAG: acyltransferase domain-containing protein, partial [bacterium]